MKIDYIQGGIASRCRTFTDGSRCYLLTEPVPCVHRQLIFINNYFKIHFFANVVHYPCKEKSTLFSQKVTSLYIAQIRNKRNKTLILESDDVTFVSAHARKIPARKCCSLKEKDHLYARNRSRRLSNFEFSAICF